MCSSRHSHWPGYMRMFTLSSLLALTCIILLGAVRCDLLTERVVWCCVTGMTKVKVGKEDSSSAEFVEKRRAALER